MSIYVSAKLMKCLNTDAELFIENMQGYKADFFCILQMLIPIKANGACLFTSCILHVAKRFPDHVKISIYPSLFLSISAQCGLHIEAF